MSRKDFHIESRQGVDDRRGTGEASKLPPQTVLFLGDDRHAEFRQAVGWLQQHTFLKRAACLDTAADQLARDPCPPHVIVIGQSRPGQFTSPQIEELHRSAPLSRLVALLGSWCEGETRTGRPWPGVVRIYWHQWLSRGQQELISEQRSGLAPWGLPRTATETETLLNSTGTPFAQGRGVIAVRALHAVTFGCLADACSAAGYGAVWLPPRQPVYVQGPTAVIWDAPHWDAAEVVQLGHLAATMQGAPLLALLNYPRLEDCQQALAAGAAAVVSKPFLVADLLVQLERAVQLAPSRRRTAA